MTDADRDTIRCALGALSAALDGTMASAGECSSPRAASEAMHHLHQIRLKLDEALKAYGLPTSWEGV